MITTRLAPLGTPSFLGDPACAGCLIEYGARLDQLLIAAPGLRAAVQLCGCCLTRFAEGERSFLIARALRAAEVAP